MKVEQEYAVFGKILKRNRIRKKFSQEKLAQLVDLTRVSIANIETGKQRVMLRDALIFAYALDFSLDEVKLEVASSKLKARLAEQPTKIQSLIERVLTDLKGDA